MLILGKGPIQGLDDTVLTVEAEHFINFSEQGNKFCLSLLYNGMGSYLFVHGVKITKFKANDSERNAALLCSGKVSKFFSFYYNGIDVVDISDMFKYFMKNHDIKIMFTLIKQMFIALLSFTGSLATKCVSLDNEPCMTGPTLIDSNSIELNYYSFMISLDKCNGSCNVLDDLSTKTCASSKTKDVNVKVFKG